MKAALDYDLLETGGCSRKTALKEMAARPGTYDERVLVVLKQSLLSFWTLGEIFQSVII